MSSQKPVVVVVLVQRDGSEFSYWGEGEIEREVKLRMEESAVTNSFDVAHVKYLPGDFSEKGAALDSRILTSGARR
ncbi:MAG: hypothetical protein JTT11_08190 [Candidatus Brockarchaeota archaeon]|nr:hypothetical protein [Candidatus Brockarchaeota archaeon]